MKNNRFIASVAMLALSAVLVACGGGGGDSGGGGGGGSTAVITKGVMAKGSVIVNGVRYDDTAAQIRREDDIVTTVTATTLDDGMVVKVKGRRNDDGMTGTAEKIEVENEVRGTVTSVGTGTFGVLGQTVIVSSSTVTAGGWSYNTATGAITSLAAADYVEVHGERNAAGAIVASRVEKFGAAGQDELRGIVSGLATTFAPGDSFSINGFVISTNGSTTVMPAGSSVVNGTLVEVHLAAGLASRIEVEDAEDVEFEPAEGQEVEVEGLVANFDGISDFDISGTHVHTTASTRYEGGIFGDIANDAKVEVEGHRSGSVLVASKVKFKDTVRIEANAEGTAPIVSLGRTIYVTGGTEIVNGPVSGGDGLRIRGYLNSDGTTITATRIEKLSNPVAVDKKILQGPVSAKDETAKTLTIIGITVDLSSVPANEIKDDNDNIITLSQFYASITLNRTAVKVRGTNGATFVADKAEIE